MTDQTLKPGRYLTQVQSWGIRETNSGEPQVYAKFLVGAQNLTWFGSLKEGKAREITLKALVTMGFKGDDLTELVVNDAALDKDKDLAIVLDYDTNQETGEQRLRVLWVNDVDGGQMKGQMSKDDALKKLKMLKVKGDLMKIRKDMNVQGEEDGDPPF